MNTCLALFERMKVKDNECFYKYTVNEDDSLSRFFWCDGVSRAEYKLFGDVLLFDSTYKKNTYLYPLVIFSGVNNHGSTCIFGASFMQNETIESYRWLLQAFLESMDGRVPGPVLTDQDLSMGAAIVPESPRTKHRLCSWHLGRNVRQNIKVPGFCSNFMGLLKDPCSVDEFEIGWANIVEMHGVAEMQWVVDIYEKKEMWAEAYFRGYFMAMTWTTQRAESMNSLIKLSVKQKMSLTDFTKHYNRTLQKLRSDFLTEQTDSKMSKPVVRESSLQRLEEHATSICSKKIFQIIREEIKAEHDVVVESNIKIDEDKYTFVFGNYEIPTNEKYSVNIDKSQGIFKCTCLKLESEGVPCRHIISAFKFMRITKFPDRSICSRWLIDTCRMLKSKFPEAIPLVEPQ